MTPSTAATLPDRQPVPPAPFPGLTRLESWGGILASEAHVFQPDNLEDVRRACLEARRAGLSIAPRGAGCSYSDTALNGGGAVIDFSRMNRILAWDAAAGELTVEPGVTLQQAWQTAVPDGWWPPVATGTMLTTLGGCAAMNVHGKNQYRIGSFGDHVVEFDLLLPSGEIVRCDRERHGDLFHAAIGGLGLLGFFVQLKLRMLRAPTGLLDVGVASPASLDGMFEQFERWADSDYLVGWIDGYATGGGLGRGIIHRARVLRADEVADPARTLSLDTQKLAHSWLQFPWAIAMNTLGLARMPLTIHMVNAIKYHASRLVHAHPDRTVRRNLANFCFLLDTIPEWKHAFRGLFQYQCLIPRPEAPAVFRRILTMARQAGLPPCLGVMKRHVPDPFMLSYTLDGYSLAIDFPVAGNLEAVGRLTARMDELVREAGGRLYLAKNYSAFSPLREELFAPGRLDQFAALKRRFDPENMLQTDLSRRLIRTA